MKCPECGSAVVLTDKRPIVSGGAILFAHTCEPCGWTWSDTNRGEGEQPEAPTVHVDDKAEAAAAEFLSVADGFDPEDVEDGDTVRVLYRGNEVEAVVNSVTRKTVLCEIDEEPDIRIQKKHILGRYV